MGKHKLIARSEGLSRFQLRNAITDDALEVGSIGGFRAWVGFHLPKKLSEGVKQGEAR